MITAYLHAAVLDGTAQMRRIPNATVLVENGKIRSVEENGAVPLNCKTVDLRGKTLLPGLINLHCHLPGNGKPQKIDGSTAGLIQEQLKSPIGRFIMKEMSAASAKTELLSGTTTIRTVGGLADFDAQIRDEIAAGKRVGTRIVAGNEAVSVPGGHMAGTFAYISHSTDEAVTLVDKIAAGKPDLIKLMITGGTLDIEKIGDEERVLMPPEQVKAACDEAHRLGYRVAAHVQGAPGMRVAVENGVDTVEHGGDMDDALIALFKEKGAALTSTITVVTFVALGTSLPELVTAITSLVKGHSDLSLGNVVGANVFNLVLVSGVSVTLAPFEIPQSSTLFGINSSLVLEIPVMLAVMLILTIPALARGKLSRAQGVMLLAIYAVFCVMQFAL